MKRKGSSQKTMQALIEAAIRLLDRRGGGDVSVREIAAEAGVNHGLVHHYFGSKEGLLREAIVRASALVSREHPPGVSVSWSFDFFRKNPALARVLARVCLDGPLDLLALAAPPRKIREERVAAVRRALERAGLAGAIEPRILNALAVVAVIGWFVLAPLLERGFDLPPDADDEVARVFAFIDAVVARQ